MKRRGKRSANARVKRSADTGSPAYFSHAYIWTKTEASTEESAKLLPRYLVSTRKLLMSAFPDGVPEKQLEAIAAVLGEHLSLRNIAKVLQACGCVADGEGYHFALAAMADADLEQNRQRQEEVIELLREHGLDDWLQEDELPGDQGN